MTWAELRTRLQAMLARCDAIASRIDALQTHRDFFDVTLKLGVV